MASACFSTGRAATFLSSSTTKSLSSSHRIISFSLAEYLPFPVKAPNQNRLPFCKYLSARSKARFSAPVRLYVDFEGKSFLSGSRIRTRSSILSLIQGQRLVQSAMSTVVTNVSSSTEVGLREEEKLEAKNGSKGGEKRGRMLEELEWENTFVEEMPGDTNRENFVRIVRNACYSFADPSVKLSDSNLVAWSEDSAHLIGLDTSEFERPEFVSIFGGGAVLKGCQPYAQCYGGHQFGHWAGQLGDGRAISLGEVVVRGRGSDRGTEGVAKERWELQLKGAGKTPYSRSADGRAVLRSSIREFLASEAMFHLGIPTTRALSIVTTGEKVIRDMFYDGNAKLEPGAVVCRMAPTFLRFGSLQIHASRGGMEKEIVRLLANYAIKYHFPDLNDLPEPEPGSVVEQAPEGEEDSAVDKVDPKQNRFTAWFAEVAERTGRLVAEWQGVGFTHGVLNTDNMSVLGLTIDFGPFGFMDAFDPRFTPNTSDLPGRRYCFENQPDVGLWNIVQLANTLVTAGLMGVPEAQFGVSRYAETFSEAYQSIMKAKLGMEEYDKNLTQTLYKHMAKDKVDFTNFFRALSNINSGPLVSDDELLYPLSEVLRDMEEERKTVWISWLREYSSKIAAQRKSDAERKVEMDKVNPKFVLRNYLCQSAIEAAESNDYSEVRRLLEVIKRPFDEQEGMEEFAQPPPEWARRPGVCMLSCSS